MYQIDGSTAATSKPASTALGTVGYFTDGNPATGVPATIVPAEFFNSVMLELMNAITGAGLPLSKSTTNQLYTAIQTIAQGVGPTTRWTQARQTRTRQPMRQRLPHRATAWCGRSRSRRPTRALVRSRLMVPPPRTRFTASPVQRSKVAKCPRTVSR